MHLCSWAILVCSFLEISLSVLGSCYLLLWWRIAQKRQDLKIWGTKAASFHLPLIYLSSWHFLELRMCLLFSSLCFCKILYLRGTVTRSLISCTWVGNYFRVGRCPLTPFIVSPGEKLLGKDDPIPHNTFLYYLKHWKAGFFFLLSSRILKTMHKHNICPESSHFFFQHCMFPCFAAMYIIFIIGRGNRKLVVPCFRNSVHNLLILFFLGEGIFISWLILYM